jgi:hypothetical protein
MPIGSIFIVLICGAGDAVKPETFVLNCQLFRKKCILLLKIHFHVCASNTEQQKHNRCAPHQPWQCSIWPNTTTNQHTQGTSQSKRMIATSSYDFITVDCYLVAFFSNLIKIAPPWPCWPWQSQFWDGSTSNPTKTARIYLLVLKLNSDLSRFF